VLPCEVRVTSPLHPLFGRLLQATGFKRWDGDLLLVVVLPDGSPGTIRAEVTDVLGVLEAALPVSVLSVDGVRHLRRLLAGSSWPMRSRSRPQTRK
jgi:hypothetical protein